MLLMLTQVVYITDWMRQSAFYTEPVPKTPAQIAAHDWMYGIHSNIPLCCVREFAGYTGPNRYMLNRDKWRRLGKATQWFNYVPCEGCIKKVLLGTFKKSDVTKLHECDFRRPECRLAFLGSAKEIEL